MGAKFKSKKIYFTRFFYFWRRFFRVLDAKYEKSTNMTVKNFFQSKKYQKTQNFMLISDPWENFFKNAPKTGINKTSLTNMNIHVSGKSAYFCHILLITFFQYIFVKIFNSFEISLKFFDTHH
jgi:hypothetical protein